MSDGSIDIAATTIVAETTNFNKKATTTTINKNKNDTLTILYSIPYGDR